MINDVIDIGVKGKEKLTCVIMVCNYEIITDNEVYFRYLVSRDLLGESSDSFVLK
jgi:hypothetical protein